MKIEFLTETDNDDYEPRERHSILVDGVERMAQADWICPEDVKFYRDLTSPHECENIIKEAIEAIKRGEEVIFEHVTSEDFV